MGKRTYRTVDFNRFDWTKAQALERLIVGVDVAKHDFVAALETPEGCRLGVVKWRHPRDTRGLLEVLDERLAGVRLEVVMESSGTYGDALRWQLFRRGVAVYRVSAKHVHDAAEVFDGVASLHDGKSAALIAELHRQGRSRRREMESEQRRRGKALLRRVELAQERYQRAFNRLEARLSRHWPELGEVARLDGTAVQRLLAACGSPDAVAASGEQAVEELRRWSRWRLSRERCEAVVASAVETLGMPCCAHERADLQGLAAELLEASQARREGERAVDREVDEDPVLTRWSEVVGRTTAVVLRCALGVPKGYASARAYLKAAGLNLKERSSGKHQGRLRLTKRGPGVARQYLYFAVLRWLQRDAWASAWYEAKIARDGGLKGKAITALMRKLLRALWACARSGEAFDTGRLFAPGRA